MNINANHSRVNDTFLSKIEKKTLIWIASKMPDKITSDHMTILGLFASFFIFVSYCLTNINKYFLWAANFGFLLNWLGDSLDGTLARYRKRERPRYGFFIDHTLDAISESAIFIGIGFSPYVEFEFALLALVGYLTLSVYVYVKTFVFGVFQISFGKIGPTEMRILIVILNIILFYYEKLNFLFLGFRFNLLDAIGLLLYFGMSLHFIINVYKDSRILKKEDESSLK